MVDDDDTPEGWHWSKGIPVALILTIVAQSMGAIWWAASTTTTLQQAVVQIDRNSQDINVLSNIEPRMVRVETDISYIRIAVDDNKQTMKELQQQLLKFIHEAETRRRE